MKKREYAVLFLLLGFMFGLLFHVVDPARKYVGLKERYAITVEIDTIKNEIEQLKVKRAALVEQLESVNLAFEDIRLQYEDLITTEVEYAKMISGATALEGPGIIVFVTDGSRELGADENPNNLLVHDLDVRSIVDDLRNAGAEAISINNQRILFQESRIYCTGPTIRINDEVFAPPYIIKAIGDRKFLEAAINEPESFSEILRGYGVQIEANTAISVVIPPIERER
ncbi:MAG: DUF881 domain-containing protein [Bacillota bacterium]|nr:DUF881 domain-containing protein [Bacillota bacterium]